jgi:hypothetical protein
LIGTESYSVIRELGPIPLYMSTVVTNQNLTIYWSGLGTNYLYTLESRLQGNNEWKPISGANWLMNTNQWTMPLSATGSAVFRVRAEGEKN